MIDVLVAGAGPVGLATALYAERAGLSVEVVDPRDTPIDKACGEGLMPGALAALRGLGVDPPGSDFRGIRYTDGKRTAVAHFRAGPGRGVRRTTLEATLLARLAERGITVRQGSVTEMSQSPTSVTAAGTTARYLVAADGLHSPIRRRLGLATARPRSRHARWGQRQHFAVAPWTDLVEVHWSEHSEAYVTPVGDGTIGVAVLSTRRLPYATLLAEFPVLAGKLPAAAATSAIRGAGPLWQGATTRVRGRVLLVGDAAGYVDALTGEGIAVGLAGARALVQCMAADAPSAYERRWRRSSLRYRSITETLLYAARTPVLRRTIVPTSALLPPVFGAVVRQLAH